MSGSFPTTHWSAILTAGQGTGTAAHTALTELCRTYWYPIYAFARRKGHQHADAQDLTQAFFSHLIQDQLVRKADSHKGRFRSFLLGCFTLFLASDQERAQALKRGGGSLMIPLELPNAEQRFAGEAQLTANPEELFDRHWTLAVLDAALDRLEDEMKESGRAALFDALLPRLQGDNDGDDYAEIARRLGTTEGTIKVTVHRLRHRYRELIRMTIAQTVYNPMDVDAELSHLMAAIRR